MGQILNSKQAMAIAFIAHWGFCGCLYYTNNKHIIKYGDLLCMQELDLYSYIYSVHGDYN